jgi:hypothetical protein
VPSLRALMGKWAKECNDVERLVGICSSALDTGVFDPVAWIWSALKNHDEIAIRLDPGRAPPIDVKGFTPEQRHRWDVGHYVTLGEWSYHKMMPPSYVGPPISSAPQ